MKKQSKHNFIYVGVDLHKSTHTAVIINSENEKLGEITIENRVPEFSKLIKFVDKKNKEGLTPVFGLEDVGGNGRSLAVYLCQNQYTVKAVNAALATSLRKSRPHSIKSDSWDAQCVAKVLYDEIWNLPDADPQDIYFTIGQVVGSRMNMMKSFTILRHQLHTQLAYNYPKYQSFFSDMFGKGAMAFWNEYPSPRHLKNVSEEELTLFLRKASKNSLSTKKAKAIKELVEQGGDTERENQEYFDFLIREYIAEAKYKQDALQRYDEQLKSLMNQLDYKLETMPGIDTLTAAKIVAEIQDINRFSSADKLARYAGIAPVPYSSGGNHRMRKSKQGNRVLNQIFYMLALQQIQMSKKGDPRNPLARQYYDRKKEEGKTRMQAQVCVMRLMVNIIYSMMKKKTPYRQPEPVTEVPQKLAS